MLERTGTRLTPRADDGIRTRDPHLGKVMRYQLRYVRIPSREGPTLADTMTMGVAGLGGMPPVQAGCDGA